MYSESEIVSLIFRANVDENGLREFESHGVCQKGQEVVVDCLPEERK